MKLSHKFCIEINKHKLFQLSKGKRQKSVLYIHWFWGEKKNQVLNVTVRCIYTYWIQFLGFLFVQNFWVTSYRRSRATVHRILWHGLCLGQRATASPHCTKRRDMGFVGEQTQIMFFAHWFIADPHLTLHTPGSCFTSVSYQHNNEYLRYPSFSAKGWHSLLLSGQVALPLVSLSVPFENMPCLFVFFFAFFLCILSFTS